LRNTQVNKESCMDVSTMKAAVAAIERGDSFALVTVVEADGSSPGRPGQKILVYGDGRTEGTVGGGGLEHRARQDTMEMLRRGKGGVISYTLDSDTQATIGMICGGRVTLSVEVFAPPVRLLLCGGGHVAFALARLCRELGFIHTVVDGRDGLATAERFPAAAALIEEEPPRFVTDHGTAGFTHVIILTHDHHLDRETLFALHRIDFPGCIGMIGSRGKWQETRRALEEAGVPPVWCDRVRCPIGIPIRSSNPAEIAVSIVAQILQDIGREESGNAGQ
jgi:xanthine dehydrogenase accessory factor